MTMPDTEDYIVFDRTGTPHVVVAAQTEIGGNCLENGNREVARFLGQGELRLEALEGEGK